MIYIILIVLALVIMWKISVLSDSVRRLQEEIIDLKKEGISTTAASVVSPVHSLASYGQTNQVVLPAHPDEADFMIPQWFKENMLLKIGVLMILAGFGWFVSYAFIHNWIGPVGRIALGFLVGTVVTVYGTIRLGKNEVQGNLFTILGSALVVITALAGHYYYDFFSALSVLGMTFLVSLYVSATALGYSVEKLAVYGLLMSLCAPFFSHTSAIDPVILYAYLFIVSVSFIGLALLKNWRSLITLGITGILLYTFSIIMGGGYIRTDTQYIILSLVYIISTTYLCVSLWNLIQNRMQASAHDAYLTIVNTGVILSATIEIVPPIYQSLVVICWMLVYAFSGFFVFQKTKNEKLFYIHALVSILLLAIATSIELSGATLVIAFTIEAAVVIVSSYVITNSMSLAHKFGLLLAGPCVLSLMSFTSSKWDNGFLHSDFFVLLVIALVLWAVGSMYELRREEKNEDIEPHQLVYILATVYAYALIWLSTHSIFVSDDTAVFVSLIIFTIVGLCTHFVGLFRGSKILNNYGKILLIAVVARLLLVDVWDMELALRVITFIVLGIMFISTAFIGKKQQTNLTPSI